MVCYDRLWKLLIDKKIKKMNLKDMAGISSTTLSQLGKEKYVSLAIIEKICRSLQCTVDDILEFVD